MNMLLNLLTGIGIGLFCEGNCLKTIGALLVYSMIMLKNQRNSL